MTSLDERANGQRVALPVGSEMVLRLEENPTTGYRWQMDSPGSPALKLAADRYEAPERGKAGAPGHHVWSFRAVAPRSGIVHLSYRRRFGGIASTFAVEVQVR